MTVPDATGPPPRRDLVYRLMVRLGRAIFAALRLRRTVTGQDNLPTSGGAVLAITHFGYLDFALAEWAVWRAQGRHVRFLATKASFDHPVAGPLMRAMGHIPVDRKAGAGAYAEAVAALQRGELIGIFPEGRVSRTWTVLDCKSGALRLAAEAGVPLLPVTVWGGHRVSTKGRILPGRRSLGVPVLIDIGPPLHVAQPADASQLQAALDTQMRAAQSRYPDSGRSAPAWWQPAWIGGAAPPPDNRSAPGNELS